MQVNPIVYRLLADVYGLGGAALHSTTGGSEGDKPVYLVEHQGVKHIVRVYPPDNTRSDVTALVQVLMLLEEKDYPAERLTPAVDGTGFVSADGWRLVLTSFAEGTPADQSISLPSLYRLGAALGRLHALFTPEELVAYSMPIAERNIEAEMTMAMDDLLAVSPVPPAQETYRAELFNAVNDVNCCEDLPYVLIHNDFQPGNILLMPNDHYAVIDWDGAGRSPAVADLGYLISSVHPEGSPRPDADHIQAIVDGYVQHHHLSADELDRLPDVIRFRPLTYLTSDFGPYINDPDHIDQSYLDALAAYRTADEAAAIARERLERGT
jgi:Ser/Thr protein kinase RdoA (MazF antagonist)